MGGEECPATPHTEVSSRGGQVGNIIRFYNSPYFSMGILSTVIKIREALFSGGAFDLLLDQLKLF